MAFILQGFGERFVSLPRLSRLERRCRGCFPESCPPGLRLYLDLVNGPPRSAMRQDGSPVRAAKSGADHGGPDPPRSGRAGELDLDRDWTSPSCEPDRPGKRPV